MNKRSFKKDCFKKLALCGLVAGVCSIQQVSGEENNKNKNSSQNEDPNEGNLGYYLMTEDDLLLELNDEAYKLYMTLDDKGKTLAREVASTRCAQSNQCKGLNACATEKNACAGQGQCKGTGKCGLSDKNLAVKLVAKKLGVEKRAKSLNPKQK